ncbi:MAG: zinc-ribbon domain-containing protein [Chloroflexi bacterium]|nr:zinc-ribbon domain-containing protein [Chloroflexota bacterium]
MQSFCRTPVEGGHRLYSLGPLEITLIVLAVILVFGVGKLANVGGALGKSIREFRRERDRKDDDVPQVTTTEAKGNKAVAQLEAEPATEKACPNCGEKMPQNAKFCMRCGAKMQGHG